MNYFSCRTEYFKGSFFPWVIGERNKLNPEILSSGSYNIFWKLLLNFIRPSASKVYSINNTFGIKLITSLRLGFSHLRDLKFRHIFQDTLNPYCSCSIEAESYSHYFLRCDFFDALRDTIINNLRIIDNNLLTVRDENLTNVLLYGNQIYGDKTNQIILMHVIDILKIHKNLMNLFLIRHKLFVTSYTFVSVSLLNI